MSHVLNFEHTIAELQEKGRHFFPVEIRDDLQTWDTQVINVNVLELKDLIH